MKNTKRRYFHASKTRFKIGQRLSATSSQIVGKNYEFSGHYIYMTTDGYIHHTVADKAASERWFVYEVEPINPKAVYRGCWDEWVTQEVEVIKLIGRAGNFGTGLTRFQSASMKTKKGFKTVLFDPQLAKEGKWNMKFID